MGPTTTHPAEGDSKDAAPSRRTFLKIATSAGMAAALGTTAASVSDTPLREVTVRLEAWRVRPGAEVPLVAEGRQPAHGALTVHLVEWDAVRGQILMHLESVSASAKEGCWRALVSAPADPQRSESHRAGRESYWLAAAIRHPDGQLSVSEPIEVICTPLCAGA
ncbi:MAG: hypothetical protein AAFX99_27740 [Myxococcota bacterium]